MIKSAMAVAEAVFQTHRTENDDEPKKKTKPIKFANAGGTSMAMKSQKAIHSGSK